MPFSKFLLNKVKTDRGLLVISVNMFVSFFMIMFVSYTNACFKQAGNKPCSTSLFIRCAITGDRYSITNSNARRKILLSLYSVSFKVFTREMITFEVTGDKNKNEDCEAVPSWSGDIFIEGFF